MSTIRAYGSLSGKASQTGSLRGQLSVSSPSIESYQGPYLVTPPPWADTILDTKDKMMSENLTVERIPYSQTFNASNGLTVTISDGG